MREPGRYVGHFRLRLVEFAPTRLVFDIEREADRRVEVTFTLDPQRFQEASFALFSVGSNKRVLRVVDHVAHQKLVALTLCNSAFGRTPAPGHEEIRSTPPCPPAADTIAWTYLAGKRGQSWRNLAQKP